MRGKLLWGALIMAAGISLVLSGASEKAEKARTPLQKFNLADLASGESRTFGEGDHSLTATRRGDDIEITYKTEDGSQLKTHTLHCAVGKDSCLAYIADDAGKGNVVVLSKEGAGKDGAGKEVTKVVLSSGDADTKDIMVFASGAGDVTDEDHFVMASAGPGMTWVTADGAEAKAGVRVVQVGDEGTTMLRCPEGDSTLTLKKGEENSGPYFCPRHNLKMEPVKGNVIIKKVTVDTHSKSEEY